MACSMMSAKTIRLHVITMPIHPFLVIPWQRTKNDKRANPHVRLERLTLLACISEIRQPIKMKIRKQRHLFSLILPPNSAINVAKKTIAHASHFPYWQSKLDYQQSPMLDNIVAMTDTERKLLLMMVMLRMVIRCF